MRLTDEQVRGLAGDDREDFIRELAKTDAFQIRTHRHHKDAMHLHRIAHGIDSASRERQAQDAIDRSPSRTNADEIQELQRHPAFNNHLDPQHDRVFQRWLSLHK